MNNNTNNSNKKNNIQIKFSNSNNNILKVQNFTFSYNQREDRILFIVNHENVNTRIDFFVTRRMMIKLLEAFDDILIKHCNNGKVFKELYSNQEVLKVEKPIKNDTNIKEKSTSVKENKSSLQQKQKWEKSIDTNDLNFTKTKEPIILDTLSYSIDKNKLLVFKFVSNNKIQAISTMDTTIYQRTISSLMRVIPFVAWGISPHILD